MKVGFIGLGRMGQGMAHRLVAGGHDLAVYDVVAAAADSLVAAGARRAQDIRDACLDREVVITMLVEDAHVLEAALGRDGLRDAMKPGAVHVAMGTYGVDAIVALESAHRAADQHLVAAPVLGRPDLAAAGQLGLIAAGPPDAIERCTPLLALLGRRVFHAGARAESATAIKLANNHLLGCALVAMAEGFSLVRKAGAAPELLYQLLSHAGLEAPAYMGYGRTMVEGTFDRVGSPVTVGLKDSLLIRAAAARRALPMPSLNVYRDRLLGAVAHGDGGLDQAALAREQARAAGIDA